MRGLTLWLVPITLCLASAHRARAGDCNRNGIEDDQDIAGGESQDCNANGVPDECDLIAGLAFAAPVEVTNVLDPKSLLIGDLNGDGYSDLAVVHEDRFGSTMVSVLLNDGTGAFSARAESPMPSSPAPVILADVDADGALDLVAGYLPRRPHLGVPSPGSVSVLRNNGDGSFAAAENYFFTGTPMCVVAADLDGDAYLDLVIPGAVLWNNGDGTFGPAVDLSVSGSCVDVADLDGDGDVDIAVAHSSFRVSILRNDGAGNFEVTVYISTRKDVHTVMLRDLDGDGDPDLAGLTPGFDSIAVRRNNGDGTFGAPAYYPLGERADTMAAPDLDGDGFLDLVLTVRAVWDAGCQCPVGGSVKVLRNRADGTFAPAEDVVLGVDAFWIAAGDLDHDARPDLALASSRSDTVSIIINQTEPSTSRDVNRNGTPDECEPGDFDGDGDVDLADYLSLAVCFSGADVPHPPGCAILDLDADGDVDLADVLAVQNAFTGSR